MTLPEAAGAAQAPPSPPPYRQSLRRRREQLLASPLGGPARALGRAGGAGVLAIALAELHATDDPGVICPLRRLTGVPCPVCGSTTVFMELGAGHLGAAVAANPVTVLVGLGLLLAPLGGGMTGRGTAGRGTLGAWWWRQPVRRRNTVIAVAASVSWLWQLHRFGFLPI